MALGAAARAAALLLACLSTEGNATDWTTTDDVAWTSAVETSDGNEARLEVRCRPDPEVRLLHPSLDALEADTTDRRSGWYGIVRVTGGWGLELRRPEHHGAITYWWRCDTTRGCLSAREPVWIIRQLKRSWTWYLRASPRNRPVVDMRFSLAGSRHAIETACRDGSGMTP